MDKVKKDYIAGPSLGEEVPDCSFAEFFFPILKSHPKGNIIQVDGITGYEETSEELLNKSLKVSESFSKLGLSQNDVFCLLAKNSSRVYSVVLGVYWFGGILAAFDTDWNIHELQSMFNKIKPAVIICEEVTEKIVRVLNNTGIEAKIIVLTEKKKVEKPHISFDELLEIDVDVENYVPKPVESPSTKITLILPTSGTTGSSKGVGLTHKILIFQTISNGKLQLWHSCNNFLVLSHFFWITCSYSFILSIYYGMKKTYISEVNTKNTLNAIHKYKPDVTLMSPSLFSQIVNHPDVGNYDLSSLKIILLGGSMLTESVIESGKKIWKEKLPVINIYGITELSGLLALTDLGVNLLSVGKPTFEVKVKVTDVDSGKSLGPNEKGEICIQYPGVMKGYIDDEEQTKAFIVDGWCHTGDVGYYDEEDNIYITGRIKEMIKDRNRQISPTEIENVIGLISGVKDAAVVGIEKDTGETELIGLVVKKEGSDVTENTIKNIVKVNLAEYKQLKKVKFVDSLPHTSSGKLSRKNLKEIALS